MKKVLSVLVILTVMGLAAQVNAAYYLAGSFNGWNSAGQLMTDNLDGTYSATVTGLVVGEKYEFKVTDGTWDTAYPSANSWLFSDDSGNVTITFNENVLSDGWLPEQFRVGVSTDPGDWSLVGDYNVWNNADPTQKMTLLGNGIYMKSHVFAAGDHLLKATNTGSWDAIGTDGRSVDAWNYDLSLDSEAEVEIYIDAYNGTIGIDLDLEFVDQPHDPDPNDGAEDVLVDALELSWAVALTPSLADPNVLDVDPNLVEHKLYMSTSTDPNLVYVDTVTGWDVSLRASHILASSLDMDSQYLWRVDEVLDNTEEITGDIWTFYTQLSVPIIILQPEHQLVDATTTASFEIAVTSLSVETYQWRVIADGVDTEVVDGVDVSGATTNMLEVANAEVGDEGAYYCIVNNDSGTPAVSESALLAVKRKIAYWPFDGGNYDSVIIDSPISVLYNDPDFTADSVSGNAMAFDDDPNSQDMLIADPAKAAYFDACNYNMTVGAWIKAPSAVTWGAIVSRNGEDGEGWQLRHNGNSLDKISFTTRGVGDPDDGQPSNRTVYDGDWHYAVATYDGAVKKVYIDGVLVRAYSSEDGSIAQEGEAAMGVINSTLSPVAMAGRVRLDSYVEADKVTACILDEVEIYNYALDGATIAQIYADLSGNAVCPAPLENDLTGDCKVNLDDFAKMAMMWLTDTTIQPQ